MLFAPVLLEPRDEVGRQSVDPIAEQDRQRHLIVSSGDALKVQPRDQLLGAARPLEIRRQQARVKVRACTVNGHKPSAPAPRHRRSTSAQCPSVDSRCVPRTPPFQGCEVHQNSQYTITIVFRPVVNATAETTGEALQVFLMQRLAGAGHCPPPRTPATALLGKRKIAVHRDTIHAATLTVERRLAIGRKLRKLVHGQTDRARANFRSQGVGAQALENDSVRDQFGCSPQGLIRPSVGRRLIRHEAWPVVRPGMRAGARRQAWRSICAVWRA